MKSKGKVDKPVAKGKFWMLDHVRNEQITCFGDGYRVFMLILQGTSSMGQIDVTQAELAVRSGLSERAIRDHYAKFKADGLIERRRNGNGRVKFFVTPEYFWNYKLDIRDDKVARRKGFSSQTAEKMAIQGMEVIDGGKS